MDMADNIKSTHIKCIIYFPVLDQNTNRNKLISVGAVYQQLSFHAKYFLSGNKFVFNQSILYL